MILHKTLSHSRPISLQPLGAENYGRQLKAELCNTPTSSFNLLQESISNGTPYERTEGEEEEEEGEEEQGSERKRNCLFFRIPFEHVGIKNVTKKTLSQQKTLTMITIH